MTKAKAIEVTDHDGDYLVILFLYSSTSSLAVLLFVYRLDEAQKKMTAISTVHHLKQWITLCLFHHQMVEARVEEFRRGRTLKEKQKLSCLIMRRKSAPFRRRLSRTSSALAMRWKQSK